jgi:hypothetical protein
MKGIRKPTKKLNKSFDKFKKPYQAVINPILTIPDNSRDAKARKMATDKASLVVRGRNVTLLENQQSEKYIPKHLISALFYHKATESKPKDAKENLEVGWNGSNNLFSTNRSKNFRTTKTADLKNGENSDASKEFKLLNDGLRKVLIHVYEEIVKALQEKSGEEDNGDRKLITEAFSHLISVFKAKKIILSDESQRNKIFLTKEEFHNFFKENFPDIEKGPLNKIFEALSDRDEWHKNLKKFSLEILAHNLDLYLLKNDPMSKIHNKAYENELVSHIDQFIEMNSASPSKIIVTSSLKYRTDLKNLGNFLPVDWKINGDHILFVEKRTAVQLFGEVKRVLEKVMAGSKGVLLRKIKYIHTEFREDAYTKSVWMNFLTSIDGEWDIENLEASFNTAFDRETHQLDRMASVLDKFQRSKKELNEDKFCIMELPEWITINLSDSLEADTFLRLVDIFKARMRNSVGESGVHHTIIYSMQELSIAFEEYCEKIKKKYEKISHLIETIMCLRECYYKPTLKHSLNIKMSNTLTKRLILDLLLDIDKKIEFELAFASDLFKFYYDIKQLTSPDLSVLKINDYKHVFKDCKDMSDLRIDLSLMASELENNRKTKIIPEFPLIVSQQKEFLPSKFVNPIFSDNYNTCEYTSLYSGQFYKERILEQLQADQKSSWVARAHHIETLTEHPLSLKDNMINVKYMNLTAVKDFKSPNYINNLSSFTSEQEKNLLGKINSKQQLIQSLEDHLEQTRNRLKDISANSKYHPTITKNDAEKVNYFAHNLEFIKNRATEYKETEGFSYEAILDKLRKQENDILEQKREQHINSIKGEHKIWNFSSGDRENQKFVEGNLPAKSQFGDSLINKLNIKGLY